jgi:hypothetical protein
LLGFANVSAPNGVSGFGYEPIGVYGEAEVDQTNGFGTAIGVEAVSSLSPFFAYNSKTRTDIELASQSDLIASEHFNVDNTGDVYADRVVTDKGSYVRTTGFSGTKRMSYSARTTTPVMEDFGEAQLVDGRGYVKLDPALADVIDRRHAYFVFITPEGDSNGLYVTQKSPAGFVVREQRAGRSTLAFQYRILAKPVDDDATRLALAAPLPLHERPGLHLGRQRSAPPPPLDPIARLRSHLGPAAFASELKAARTIETAP